ncbi:MAG: adenosine deaminase family protein [Candidatus Acidiferrales bacterium]
MRKLRVSGFSFLILVALIFLRADSHAQSTAKSETPQGGTPEERASRGMEAARGNPLQLRHWLEGMPKGADLHMHLSGAVYAETWIREAAEDNLCVDLATYSFKWPETVGSASSPPVCGAYRVPASQAFTDQHLYDQLVDAFSMRSFVPSAGVSGHDHFFDTFGKFGADHNHAGEWLDEVAVRAARQNEEYLEIMETPDIGHAAQIAKQLGWNDDLAKLREDLLANGLQQDVAAARAFFDGEESARRELEHCGKADASPGCSVTIRFLFQILRGRPKEVVFAQTVMGFEVASSDPRVVGINFVMPEDGYVSMSDYALHMRMVGFLHGVYPRVHISLHAGELAPGLVPYEGLCCHIRLAVEEAHAERIGHGVDVMYEERPHQLLKEMAAKHVMVEINLTSNDVILGVAGKEHPLPLYRMIGVPVALSTDDEGVSRIDLTHEFVRAVETYGLRYPDLKQMVRTSLEHNFLPGASLWREPDNFTHAVVACSGDSLGAEKPSATCSTFLSSSEKAQQQWELERRFHAFESSQ